MGRQVTCSGVVTATTSDRLTVRAGGEESCGGCAMSAVCGGSGVELEVRGVDGCEVAVGDRVTLSCPEGARWKAIALLLAAPALMLVGGFATAVAAGVGEGLSAVAGLCLASGWYAVVYLRRHVWGSAERRVWKIENVTSRANR